MVCSCKYFREKNVARKRQKNTAGQRIVYVFIDASNLWEAQKVKGQFFDFAKLKAYLQDRYQASELRMFYYAAFPADGTREHDVDGKHKFFTFLKKGLGVTVRKKPLKRIKVPSEFGEGIEEKGDMDVELTIDVVNNIHEYDTAILFTGDSDFLALIKFIRSRSKKAHVFSSKNNISKELLTGADGYTDVLKIEKDIWGNKIRHRGQK